MKTSFLTRSEQNVIDSPVSILLDKYCDSPLLIVHERKDELLELKKKNKLNLVIDTKSDQWYYCISSPLNILWVGMSTLERIWAYGYAYNVFFEIVKEIGPGSEINLLSHEKGSIARSLLVWAIDNELHGSHNGWPDDLPSPRISNDCYVECANAIFVAINAWIILHEIGHVELGHFDEIASDSKSIDDEYAADDYASEFMLAKIPESKDGLKNFINRTVCISYALAALTGNAAYSEPQIARTHPLMFDRLLHFLDKWVGKENRDDAEPKEMAWYAAAAILGAHVDNIEYQFPTKRKYDTFREMIVESGLILQSHKGSDKSSLNCP